MLIFTYNDYLDCLENRKVQKAINIESKKNVSIKLIEANRDKQSNKINQIIEKLIQDEEEIANLINDFFKMPDLEINSNTIKRYYIQKESIIYQYKKQEIYFLIKLQEEPNYHIAYAILLECMEFMEKWKIKHNHYAKAPVIVPIVIYVGDKNWNKKQNTYIKYTTFKENSINLTYNFLDFQKCKLSQLVNKNSLISNVILLKKQLNNENLKTLEKLINKYLQIN